MINRNRSRYSYPYLMTCKNLGLTRFTLAVLVLACGLSTGCSKEAKKSRELNRAENDFKEGAYDRAKIEYLKVLRLDNRDAKAFARLGQIWYAQGSSLKAGGFLTRSRELAPDDLETRFYLARAFRDVGDLASARKEARYILARDPANGEALFLLSELATAPEEIQAARETVQKFPEKNSVSYLLAAANLALRQSQPEKAGNLISRALALDPKSPEAHRSKGILHLFRKEAPAAREEFKAAADLAPPRSKMKASYAEYLAQTSATAEAKTYLTDLTKQTPDFFPAWALLARIAFDEKRYDESTKLLENIISREPDNLDARLLQANILLAQGNGAKAIDILEALQRDHPNAPLLKYQLARAYLQNNRPEQAVDVLRLALTKSPHYTDAILLLAETNLRSGDPGAAIPYLEELLKRQPDLERAQLLLADAYRAAGRLDDAAALFQQRLQKQPAHAESYVMLGLVQREQGQSEDARKSFEAALKLAPENFTAITQVLELDLTAKDFAAATARVNQQTEKQPNAAGTYLLKGKLFAAQKNWPEAEAALRKAIEIDPKLAPAYDLLVAIYLENGRLADANKELSAALVRSPRNETVLLALAAVQEKEKNYTGAAETYRQLLGFQPNNVIVLNNLAYLYAESLGQLEEAQELARKAQSVSGNSPAVADTLGWVLYKRESYQEALGLLHTAAEKQPDDPEVQFHLAMAEYMMGQKEAAQAALERALSLAADFPHKTEAENRLKLLRGTGEGVAELEAVLKQDPKDVIVRMKLAAAYEQAGDPTQAARSYQEALRVNPSLIPAATELARLYAGPLRDKAKALQFAKTARELAPNDPKIAAIVGRIAYDAGNSTWAYSLLEESTRQLPADAGVLHSLAWAAYAGGKIGRARAAMESALEASADAQTAADATRFLSLTAVSPEQTGEIAEVKSSADAVLQSDPDYAPALMIVAASEAANGAEAQAISRYQKILGKFPDFAPAQKALAFLYAEDKSRRDEAFPLATQAYRKLPEDAAVAQLLGELSYERKDHRRAVQLLQESDQRKKLNPQGRYHLALAYQASGQKEKAKSALEQAIGAGLPAAMDQEARKLLADLKAGR